VNPVRRLLDLRLRRPGLRLMTLEALHGMRRHRAEAAIRHLCATVRLDDATTLCRVLGRYKMFVDTADLGLSPHLMLDGYWEMWVTEAILATVRPGMVAVDAGANLGYFTLLLADIVGREGRVHGFEPNPHIMRLLDRSVRLNGFAGRVRLHDAPLAASSGLPVRLVVPAGEPKNAYLSPHPPGAEPPCAEPPGALGHDLRTLCLDDAIGEGRLDFVKIDVEGAEREVWRGMRRIVARGQKLAIFLEFVTERHPSPDAFLAEFAASGFAIARIEPKRGMARVSAREILAAPADQDQMLALTRG